MRSTPAVSLAPESMSLRQNLRWTVARYLTPVTASSRRTMRLGHQRGQTAPASHGARETAESLLRAGNTPERRELGPLSPTPCRSGAQPTVRENGTCADSIAGIT